MKMIYHEDSLYEEHGATLKHKCGKKDSSVAPSLFFSHSFLFICLGSFWPLFLILES